jgi:hypothetical protein
MCWTCSRPDTGGSGAYPVGKPPRVLWPVSSPSRWNQFCTKELNRQGPQGGETAACRLLTIIAGTQPSAFGWLRTRKIQPTKPSS